MFHVRCRSRTPDTIWASEWIRDRPHRELKSQWVSPPKICCYIKYNSLAPLVYGKSKKIIHIHTLKTYLTRSQCHFFLLFYFFICTRRRRRRARYEESLTAPTKIFLKTKQVRSDFWDVFERARCVFGNACMLRKGTHMRRLNTHIWIFITNLLWIPCHVIFYLLGALRIGLN